MSPAVFAEYKSFALEQLNKNGAPVKVDDNLKAFLFDQKQEEAKPQTDTADSQEPTNDNASTATNQESNVGEFDTEPLYDPDASAESDNRSGSRLGSSEDSNGDGHPRELDHIEKLSPGQLLEQYLSVSVPSASSRPENSYQTCTRGFTTAYRSRYRRPIRHSISACSPKLRRRSQHCATRDPTFRPGKHPARGLL